MTSAPDSKTAGDVVALAAKKKNHKRHKLHVAHHTPGRVRLKIPTARGDHEAMAAIAQSFVGVPGVEDVHVNAITGSLVLKYSATQPEDVHAHLGERIGDDYQPPETDLDKLTDNIAREAEFLAQHSHTAAMIVDFFNRLDAEIKRRTHNYVDMKIVLAVVVIGGSMMELGMAAATPVWLTLAVFSVNHMVQLHQHQLLREAHAAGQSVPAGAPA